MPNNKRKKWSFAYSKFVKDPDNDILEIIAYALYKRDKAEWVKHESSIGREPTSPDTIKWADNNSTNEAIERYKKSAKSVLKNFQNQIQDSIISSLRNEITEQLQKDIPGINAARVGKIGDDLAKLIDQTNARQSFVANIQSGIAATFIWTATLALIYFILLQFGSPLPTPPSSNTQPSETSNSKDKASDKGPPKVAPPRK